jgi:hypothetical protein
MLNVSVRFYNFKFKFKSVKVQISDVTQVIVRGEWQLIDSGMATMASCYRIEV